MKKFNIVLALFLVAQSTNTYSMNALRRAASRAANRLAPKAQSLAKSLLEKSKNTLENNTKRTKRFYNTAENTLFKKVESVQSLPKQNQHSTAKKNFSIKPIINSQEKTNIKNIGLAGALGTSGAYLLLDKNNVSCDTRLSSLSFEQLCDYLRNNPNKLDIVLWTLEYDNYKEFCEIFPEYAQSLIDFVLSDKLFYFFQCREYPEYHEEKELIEYIEYINKVIPNKFKKYIVELALYNLNICKRHISGMYFSYLTQTFPEHKDQFFEFIVNNISRVMCHSYSKFAAMFPEYKEDLFKAIIERGKKHDVSGFIKYTLEIFSDHKKEIFNFAIEHFSSLDGNFIKYVVENFPEHQEQLFELTCSQFTRFKANEIRHIANAFPDKSETIIKLIEDNFHQYKYEIRNLLIYKQNYYDKNFFLKLLLVINRKYKKKNDLSKMIQDLIEEYHISCKDSQG